MLIAILIVGGCYAVLGLIAGLAWRNHDRREAARLAERIELTDEQVWAAWPDLRARICAGDLDEHCADLPREESC